MASVSNTIRTSNHMLTMFSLIARTWVIFWCVCSLTSLGDRPSPRQKSHGFALQPARLVGTGGVRRSASWLCLEALNFSLLQCSFYSPQGPQRRDSRSGQRDACHVTAEPQTRGAGLGSGEVPYEPVRHSLCLLFLATKIWGDLLCSNS